jgi:hypothetical protein
MTATTGILSRAPPARNRSGGTRTQTNTTTKSDCDSVTCGRKQMELSPVRGWSYTHYCTLVRMFWTIICDSKIGDLP